MGSDRKIDLLIQVALDAGADRAGFVSTGDIVIDEKLADMCREPGCPNYGLSGNCPPHVPGPAGLKKQLDSFHRAVFFTMAVPSGELFSSGRRRVFQRLHIIAAGIEQTAMDMGFAGARAYAGGSCREIFCFEQNDCPLLLEQGTCRYPRQARPSMSGFGIDVAGLFRTAGWTLNRAEPQAEPQPDAGTSGKADLCGLVLIC